MKWAYVLATSMSIFGVVQAVSLKRGRVFGVEQQCQPMAMTACRIAHHMQSYFSAEFIKIKVEHSSYNFFLIFPPTTTRISD